MTGVKFIIFVAASLLIIDSQEHEHAAAGCKLFRRDIQTFSNAIERFLTLVFTLSSRGKYRQAAPAQSANQWKMSKLRDNYTLIYIYR